MICRFCLISFFALLVSGVTDLTLAQDANAKRFTLFGVWSWHAQTVGGVAAITVALKEDGSYVSVRQFPGGMLERVTGTFQARAEARDHFALWVKPLTREPSTICPHVRGFTASSVCLPIELPPQQIDHMTIISPGMIEVQDPMPGMPSASFTRDFDPDFLSARIPDKMDIWLDNQTDLPFDLAGCQYRYGGSRLAFSLDCAQKTDGDL